MHLSLPEPIETYFAVSNGADIARLSSCFSADAIVIDEGDTHHGLQAIRSWQHDARQKFSYFVELLHVERDNQRVTVLTRVAGEFPGSPVQLNHVFQLADNRIRSLEIR